MLMHFNLMRIKKYIIPIKLLAIEMFTMLDKLKLKRFKQKLQIKQETEIANNGFKKVDVKQIGKFATFIKR